MKPQAWEDRIVLYVGYLINNNKKSQTVKSYISALRAVLQHDGVQLEEDRFLLSSLTKACKYKNDHVQMRLPIQRGMLKVITKHTRELFDGRGQPFLSILYCTLFTTAYFGLFRVGELTSGTHPVLAKDVHIAKNKQKIMFVLHTSKTHWKDTFPQTVKLSSCVKKGTINKIMYEDICPYIFLRQYLEMRGTYCSNDKPFFIFRDRTPVTPVHMRTTLRSILKKAGFDAKLYSVHGFRAGRSTDLRSAGISIPEIQKLGRWTSNSVFNYLK